MVIDVIRIGLPDRLQRSVGCTNAIESLMAMLRKVCRNVRLKAHKELSILRAALLGHQQALLGDNTNSRRR